MQQSAAYDEYRARRVVVEHRLARLVQLGIRQSRYFGRVKTKFQLYLAATVANLTLVAGEIGRSGSTGGGAAGHRVVRNDVHAVVANATANFSAVRLGQLSVGSRRNSSCIWRPRWPISPWWRAKSGGRAVPAAAQQATASSAMMSTLWSPMLRPISAPSGSDNYGP